MPISAYCPECSQSFTDWYAYSAHLNATCAFCQGDFCPESESHTTDCADCGAEYTCGQFTYHECEPCDCGYCGDCSPSSSSSSQERTIFNYSYRPQLQFHGTGDYFLGVELEVTADTMNARPIYDWADANGAPGLFFCKEDGSVNGFEIVTHPMTPDYFESVDWDGFFDMLNREYPTNRSGNREPVDHGIHVHVSRSAFPNVLALARWSYLVNKHADHVQRIARRAGSNWARFSANPVSEVLAQEGQRRGILDTYSYRPNRYIETPIYRCGNECGGWHEPAAPARPSTCDCGSCPDNPGSPGHFPEAYAVWGARCLIEDYRRDPNPEYARWERANRSSHDLAASVRRSRSFARFERYMALNLQNDATVEVRVFRSTRRPNEFRDAIRTVYSSVEYVRSMQPCHTTGIRDSLSWAAYVAFVASRYELLYPTVAGMDVGNPNRRIRPRDELGRFTAIRDNGFTSAAA